MLRNSFRCKNAPYEHAFLIRKGTWFLLKTVSRVMHCVTESIPPSNGIAKGCAGYAMHKGPVVMGPL